MKNRLIWVALGICVLFLLGSVYYPALATILRLERPDALAWGLILGFSLLPLIAGQIGKAWSVPSLSRQS